MDIIDLTRDSPPRDDSRHKRKRERRDGEGKRPREHSHRTRDDSRREESHHRKHKRESSRDRDRKKTENHVFDDQLFFVDSKPADVPVVHVPVQQPPTGLILPTHVTVFGDSPETIILPPAHTDSEEDDYIEYLDYFDEKKHFVRYYEGATDEKRTKVLCKKCGEEGHTKDKCSVLICQTCGARDEHSTRSCNVSRHCFSCGMRGHIRQDCPNRDAQYERMQDCERCGAPSHLSRECPTLWRLYVYLDDAEHNQILQARKEKKGLALGQGGEGYIAQDAWCYSCGNRGHFGDDCQRRPERPVERSAFSREFLSQGPFRIPDFQRDSPTRDFYDVPLPGGVENVGKQGRNKEKERLARRAKQEDEEDADDWFQNGRGVSIRGAASRERLPTGPREHLPTGPRDMAAPPMSRQRHENRSQSSRRDYDREDASRSRDSQHQKDRKRERDRGPRYRGGYSRD
ncbi:hypothetical protein C8F01DRAFT_1117467 [Mycena amicta]|nr:hypothetical protein C8F01DRAFT_1117467 [Mycena amicta]